MFFFFAIACTSDLITNFHHDEKKQNRKQVYASENSFVLSEDENQYLSSVLEPVSSYAGAGLSAFDIDQDSYVDLIVARQDGLHIYINDQQGGFYHAAFQELLQEDDIAVVAALIRTTVEENTTIHHELYVSTIHGFDQWFSLYIEESGSIEMELQTIPDSTWFSGHVDWMDLDGDGLREIAVAGYVDEHSEDFRNSFEMGIPIDGYKNTIYQENSLGGVPIKSETWSLPSMEHEGLTFSLAFVDANHDHLWDLYEVNDVGMINESNQIYWNSSSEMVLEDQHVGLRKGIFSMGLAITDINDDFLPDMFITNIGNPVFLLSSEDGWYDGTLSMNLGISEQQSTCWGADWNDVDNNGSSDLWVGCGPLPYHEGDDIPNLQNQPDSLFLQKKSGGFTDIADQWGMGQTYNTRAGGFLDINNDGCWDLIRVPLDAPTEIFIASCSDGNWIDISLFDNGEPAIGSKIQLRGKEKIWNDWYTAGGRSFATQLPFTKHFGLGDIEEITLYITWSDGEVQEMDIDEVNQHIQIER